MSAPPGYHAPVRARRDSAAIVCAVIGVVSFVAALLVGGKGTQDANSAAYQRGAAQRSASAASSSASVAASLPSPADVRARFPRPPGSYTKPDLPPSGSFTFYFVRSTTMSYEQVKAFYSREIPRAFPALSCRFAYDVPSDGPKMGEECGLREDVDFGDINVWFRGQNLNPGEIFIRLSLDG